MFELATKHTLDKSSNENNIQLVDFWYPNYHE